MGTFHHHLFSLFLLSSFLVFSSLSSSAVHDHEDYEKTQTYIVRVRNHMKPSTFSSVEEWYSSTLNTLFKSQQQEEEDDDDYNLVHVYKTVFHGFSAELTPSQFEQLKTLPEVITVFPDRLLQLHTTRSPQFLGLTGENNNQRKKGKLEEQSDYGSDVVIGVLDSGIWPERESFHDRDLGPIPAQWKGECTDGVNFTKNLCNRKLIGARFFQGYGSSRRRNPQGFPQQDGYNSPRDSEGHGTHTASTAAGRRVKNASLLGYAPGAASGIAAKARIAVYKICWPGGCSESDILAGFDKAVEDGVDVISFSVGSFQMEYQSDSVAIAAFAAMEHGVLVSASAGNSGPGDSSVTNIAPWITTVGAGSIDRRFPADLLLDNGKVITGVSLYSEKSSRKKVFFPLVYATNVSTTEESVCTSDSLDPKRVKGKIVICDRGGGVSRASKGETVKKAGGVGMVLANGGDDGETLLADAHVLPAVAITASSASALHQYMASSRKPRAKIISRGTQLNVKPAPLVAGFSSRGPNLISRYIIKPDLFAPGLNILAAWPDGVSPTGLDTDKRGTTFNILSGTSMSCPHVSGVAALLKGAHKNWSPARIRSAMMTTAYVRDNAGKPLLDDFDNKEATVWAYGSGHVDPEKAVDPGLVFDITVDDYIDFLCASKYSKSDIEAITRRSVRCSKKASKPWNLNYPSISVLFHLSNQAKKYEVAVTRTVTHVSNEASRYTVTIENPSGIVVTVVPSELEFGQEEEKKSYVVNISAEKGGLPPGKTKTVFGRMTWTDGRHVVGVPIAVTWE